MGGVLLGGGLICCQRVGHSPGTRERSALISKRLNIGHLNDLRRALRTRPWRWARVGNGRDDVGSLNRLNLLPRAFDTPLDESGGCALAHSEETRDGCGAASTREADGDALGHAFGGTDVPCADLRFPLTRSAWALRKQLEPNAPVGVVGEGAGNSEHRLAKRRSDLSSEATANTGAAERRLKLATVVRLEIRKRHGRECCGGNEPITFTHRDPPLVCTANGRVATTGEEHLECWKVESRAHAVEDLPKALLVLGAALTRSRVCTEERTVHLLTKVVVGITSALRVGGHDRVDPTDDASCDVAGHLALLHKSLNNGRVLGARRS